MAAASSAHLSLRCWPIIASELANAEHVSTFAFHLWPRLLGAERESILSSLKWSAQFAARPTSVGPASKAERERERSRATKDHPLAQLARERPPQCGPRARVGAASARLRWQLSGLKQLTGRRRRRHGQVDRSATNRSLRIPLRAPEVSQRFGGRRARAVRWRQAPAAEGWA